MKPKKIATDRDSVFLWLKDALHRAENDEIRVRYFERAAKKLGWKPSLIEARYLAWRRDRQRSR